MSSDDESSDSSNEFLVPPAKLDLDDAFFANVPSTSSTQVKSKTKRKIESSSSSSSNESEDDSLSQDTNTVDTNALLMEVMRNLEKANNLGLNNEAQSAENSAATSSPSKKDKKKTKSPRKLQKDKLDLSNEINDLLLKGESGLGSTVFGGDSDVDDAQKESETKPAQDTSYSIPKEGVVITLPGTQMMSFGRTRKKGGNDLQSQLIKRMNKRLRSTQLMIHKVGLLCWLAHGFHLNKIINDPEIMAIVLSLIPQKIYPDGRVDIKYIDGFTKWFRKLIKVEFNKANDPMTKEILLNRLSSQKAQNYRELVLIFIAALRAIGINCRLVVSLCAPPMKLKQSQLFKVKKDENEESSKEKSKERKRKSPKKRRKISNDDHDDKESSKAIPENSSRADIIAREEAKKRAVEILKSKFSASFSKKKLTKDSPKSVESSDEEKEKLNEAKNVRYTRSRVKKDDPKSSKPSTSNAKKPPNNKKNSPKKSKNSEDDEKMNEDDEDDEDNEDKKPKTLRSTGKTVNKKEVEKKNIAKSQRGRKRKLPAKKAKEEEEEEKDEEFEEDDEKKVKEESESEATIDEESESSDDSYFDKSKNQKRNRKLAPKALSRIKKASGGRERTDSEERRRVLSSDDELEQEILDVRDARYLWVEVYVESEESWISVSVPDNKVHCVSDIYKKAPTPVLYVIAWNSVGTIKDVTRRYCPHWLTVTRKQRVEEDWWKDTLAPWREKKTVMSKTEDEQLLQMELEQPLPDAVSKYKGHPLYVLARHLLKYEGLYPPDCVPLGHLKSGDAVYSRHCVHTLRSRETWLKEARVVKPKQEPYKIVKAMPKYDKFTGQVVKNQPLELFGKWQTSQYDPPVAKDGIVPRNEYGNVDLFKQCMLPKGTVHIDLPGLGRVAKKLKIDCVPAVVGFNFGCRGAMPLTEGFVVCEEYEDTLREAWKSEQILAAKRAQEKRDKRIWGNWRKLIRGMFIKQKIAAKYYNNDDDDFVDNNDDHSNDKSKEVNDSEEKPSTSKESTKSKDVAPVKRTKTDKTAAKKKKQK